MPITVTWDDGTTPAIPFTMPDDVIAAMDQFRQQALVSVQQGVLMPNYSTIKDMVIGEMLKNIVMPALNMFPTPSIQIAMAAVAAAQLALSQAQAAAIPGFTPNQG